MNKQQIKLFQSKNKDDWGTPKNILNEIKKEFGNFYDPCPFNPIEDGLKTEWKKITFVNPPYSNVKGFLEKAKEELKKGNCKVIIFLTFVNTDTKWFHNYIYNKAEIRFIKGRVKFIDKENKSFNSAMRPSMLCIFRNNKYNKK